MSNSVFAFEVTVKEKPEWARVINARTAGQAKSEYYSELLDAWPDVLWTSLRCRKIGNPQTSERFRANAAYRGMPSVRCGQSVKVGRARGVIVGHNCSANFDVLFDPDSPQYANLRLNVHPSSIEFV